MVGYIILVQVKNAVDKLEYISPKESLVPGAGITECNMCRRMSVFFFVKSCEQGSNSLSISVFCLFF